MMITRFCPLCNVEFTPGRPNQLYCSRRHAENMARRKLYWRNPERARARVSQWKAKYKNKNHRTEGGSNQTGV